MSQETANSYFEQTKTAMESFTQEDLIERIKLCQDVIDKFDSDKLWNTILEDSKRWVDRLDSQWQDIYDEKKLNNLRVLKQAYRHIANLPSKYAVDLQAAQNLLDGYRNTDSSIQKDYDNETNTED